MEAFQCRGVGFIPRIVMALISDFIARAEALSISTGQSLSTISRKVLNDGKGIARLKEGGQCTVKTMDEALVKLEALELELSGDAKLRMTHLDRLEAEAIHIMREVAAQCENPVMLYSVGKDSSVMLHLAEKAFYPSKPPFPLMHVDTTWKFKEMIAFRDRRAKEVGMELIVHTNPDGVREGVGPFTHGSAVHTDIMKTQALKQALDKYKFDAAFGGARRDEEKSRAKERIFSFRSENHRWDAKNQRPELWNIYNTRVKKGESMRVFPISNWTELDIWQYIYKEKIQIPDLYLSKKRPVVEKDGVLILVDDDRMPIGPDDVIEEKMVRFRTLGCYPLTGAVESEADTLPEVIQEMLLATTSERQGRVIDSDAGASMEQKKEEGYF
jgi:sulfate adenylyltransferase subunit 2